MSRRGSPLLGTLAVASLLLLGACASRPPAVAPLPDGDSVASRCERALAALDAEVDAAGVRDAEATRVAGFPAVRVDRFLASFAAGALEGSAFDAWQKRAIALDRSARLVEIANLPAAPTQRVLSALAAEGLSGLAPQAFLEGCGATLAARDGADAARRERLLAAARVPDDYDDVARGLGLYPLTRIGFAAGVRLYERSVLDRFAAPGTIARPVTFVPDDSPVLSPSAVQALLDRGRADPLGVPDLDASEEDALLATFAPVLVVDERSDDDRPGRPLVDASGDVGFAPMPVLFGRIAFTRFAGTTHVQLVYTIWFAARTPAFPGDPLAGRLDAVLWRVTLDRDGAPLVYDSIHGCGCYSLFVPTARVALRAPVPTLDEQALVPASLPPHDAGRRVVVELEGGTHQVRGVRLADAFPAPATRYRIGRDDALRSIALPGGATRSLYAPDGIVRGTERAERALFWPLGIRNAGAMRQWGRHATAFIGRRHFDDAFLLDRYFLPSR
jgi:hypothetical protein